MNKRRKHNDLYYLLPGQGRSGRRRKIRNLIVAVVVGLITAGLLFWFLYSVAR